LGEKCAIFISIMTVLEQRSWGPSIDHDFTHPALESAKALALIDTLRDESDLFLLSIEKITLISTASPMLIRSFFIEAVNQIHPDTTDESKQIAYSLAYVCHIMNKDVTTSVANEVNGIILRLLEQIITPVPLAISSKDKFNIESLYTATKFVKPLKS
jgi:hypothetical protein